MKKVQIVTDGSCLGNPGLGGRACLLRCDETTRELTGFKKEQTNNRMELTAAMQGLSALKESCEAEAVDESLPGEGMSMEQETSYFVLDDHTLVYLCRKNLGVYGNLSSFGVLAGDKDGHDPKNGGLFLLNSRNLRKATKADFVYFRVDSTGHLQEREEA